MASIEEIKRHPAIDMHDLAERLGLKRAAGSATSNNAMYHSPGHADKSPSLSIFVNHPKFGTGFKDWSDPDAKGSNIDLVMHVNHCNASEALKFLHLEYGIPFDKPQDKGQPAQKSTIEWMADRCLEAKDKVKEYLLGRGISEATIRAAQLARTVGFNEWTSTKKKMGEIGYGGPAAAFIARALGTGMVVGVDVRFLDPSLNGDVKTQSHGDKEGYGWTIEQTKLKRAARVVIVESAINALSVDTCGIPRTAAYALRGTNNVDLIDFSFLVGKQVVICLDNDQPFPDGHKLAGRRPGPEAAWRLYERLTAMNISAVMVDQSLWLDDKEQPINDVNDYLQAHGAADLARALDVYDQWLITGMPGDGTRKGKPRVFLPSHDFKQYWRYRHPQPDFTSYIESVSEDDNGNETPQYADLCGFRVASLSRISVASAMATMTGDDDQSPTVYFSVTVQTPRHGDQLTRKVLLDEQLHNVQHWSKFGPIWSPARFSRMVNILERTAHLGARSAANFVGLAWRDGQLIVNQGPDCYFTDAEKQCPYHDLSFPSGQASDAARVIRAYQDTFKQNAAAIPLVWGLGGHMKAILGFWPHMMLQADKGMGKSTLLKRLERSLNFTMFSGQSLTSDFRLMTSIAHTSHPVGWEELSAQRQDVIDKAVAMLQENYQYTVTRRGAGMTEFVLSAPVLLAGEDVPVRSLLGKLVRTNLTGKKGPMMPEDLPRFPVLEWLQYLAKLNKMDVMAQYHQLRDYCLAKSRAGGTDEGASRMAGNYAAVLLAWRHLCDFAGMDHSEGHFPRDLMAEMNGHISESSSDRQPWVWILEMVLSEMDAGKFNHQYKFDQVDGQQCLLVRTTHIMDHVAHSPHLRDRWNGLPVKTAAVFKRQLASAGVIVGDKEFERTIGNTRVAHLTALSLEKLGEFGLTVGIRLPPTGGGQ